MNKLNTLKISAALLLMGMSSTMAYAGGITSDITTQTADLTFASTGKATISLEAQQDLIAGAFKAGQEIASGEATATAGTVAYRWTPTSGDISQANGVSKIIKIKGTENKNNSITLALVPSTSVGTLTDGGNGWIVPATLNTSKVELSVQNNQAAVISPDTYTLSVDAAVWGY